LKKGPFPMPKISAFVALLTTVFVVFAGQGVAAENTEREDTQRIVLIGDSITDGHTYPLLLQASIKQAGKPVPICINAGIAGDTAQGMLARLDRDVFPHRPTLVTLSAGINDVLRGVSTEDYAQDMQAIAVRLKQEKIPLVILTPSVLGPKHADAEKKLAEYIAALRKIAADHGCRIAEVHDTMHAARQQGEVVLEPDEVHLTFAGYRQFTRAILDALGYEQIAVPAEITYELMPGVIKNWQVRPATEAEAKLDESGIAGVLKSEGWKEIVLPLSEKEDHWWVDQERQRGFAVSLGRHVGPGKKYLAMTVMPAGATRKGYLNTGAQVDRVWLNGKLIYKN